MKETSAVSIKWSPRRIVYGVIGVVIGGAVIFALLLALPPSRVHQTVLATNGVVEVQPDTRATVFSLSGQWLGVPGKTVSPSAFPFSESGPVTVPGSIRGTEKITYRVVIRGLKRDQRYAIHVTGIAESARIYANGTQIGTFGRPRPDGTLFPGFVPTTFLNLPRGNELELVFAVENNVHDKGGIWNEVYFGPQEELLRYRDRIYIVETLLVGALLVIAAYHFILAAIHPGEGSIAMFAMFTLFASLVSILTGQHILLRHLQPQRELPWIRLAYSAVTAAGPTLFAYTLKLFPRRAYNRVLPSLLVLAVIQIVLVWILPYAVLQRSYVIWYGITFIIFGYLFHATIRGILNRESGSAVSLMGFFFLFLFVANDILFDLRLIHTGYVVSIGLFGFILSQATVIALRYEGLFREVSDLRVHLEETVEKRTRQLQEERNRMRRLALNDDLTGLVNRRYGTELLMREVERFRRYATPLAVVLVDLDHFKDINDNRGHQVGDDVLQGFAQFLQNTTRTTDVACRWGGEEFLLILPSTSGIEAKNLCLKLQETLAAMPLDTRAGAIPITFSAGVTSLDPTVTGDSAPMETAVIMDALLRTADNGLYAAKRDGRNLIRWEDFG